MIGRAGIEGSKKKKKTMTLRTPSRHKPVNHLPNKKRAVAGKGDGVKDSFGDWEVVDIRKNK
jgi:hypothetical protein